MCYLNDGGPAHFHLHVRQQLTRVFQECWIAHGGSVRSPDLSLSDIWLWGHLNTVH
ncbi:hypothetical protein C0J52_26125 [Blattella germanica]|nr:hypothetical protein C0J52_26125 [Blattella germanica]